MFKIGELVSSCNNPTSVYRIISEPYEYQGIYSISLQLYGILNDAINPNTIYKIYHNIEVSTLYSVKVVINLVDILRK